MKELRFYLSCLLILNVPSLVFFSFFLFTVKEFQLLLPSNPLAVSLSVQFVRFMVWPNCSDIFLFPSYHFHSFDQIQVFLDMFWVKMLMKYLRLCFLFLFFCLTSLVEHDKINFLNYPANA